MDTVTHHVLCRYVAFLYLFIDHSRWASINLIWAPHTLQLTSRGRPNQYCKPQATHIIARHLEQIFCLDVFLRVCWNNMVHSVEVQWRAHTKTPHQQLDNLNQKPTLIFTWDSSYYLFLVTSFSHTLLRQIQSSHHVWSRLYKKADIR